MIAYLTFRWNAEKARQELLRHKLEELFIAVQNFSRLFTEVILSYNEVVTGGMRRDEGEPEIAK